MAAIVTKFPTTPPSGNSFLDTTAADAATAATIVSAAANVNGVFVSACNIYPYVAATALADHGMSVFSDILVEVGSAFTYSTNGVNGYRGYFAKSTSIRTSIIGSCGKGTGDDTFEVQACYRIL